MWYKGTRYSVHWVLGAGKETSGVIVAVVVVRLLRSASLLTAGQMVLGSSRQPELQQPGARQSLNLARRPYWLVFVTSASIWRDCRVKFRF